VREWHGHGPGVPLTAPVLLAGTPLLTAHGLGLAEPRSPSGRVAFSAISRSLGLHLILVGTLNGLVAAWLGGGAEGTEDEGDSKSREAISPVIAKLIIRGLLPLAALLVID
jgi:hypothetical protein